MVRAIWKGKVIAESKDTIGIEGNHYFPPASVKKEFLKESSEKSACYWKGEASYYDVVVDGEVNPGAAWYYPKPKEGSIERVGKDFANYVAFWRGVEIEG